jgi:ribulose-5-phosphate 4-epimerase/fuculose-1-phosphate aldolase
VDLRRAAAGAPPDFAQGATRLPAVVLAACLPARSLNAETAMDMAEQRSLKGKVPDAEWQVRVDLAACYRLVAHFHWDDLVFTHVTARVPGTQDQFLINPYGLMFDEITASSLVRIDVAGNKLDDSPWPVNPAGFTIHSAIHAARHDAACVLHTHTLNGVAVSAQKNGLLPISQQSIFVLSSLGYHDYEGVALRDDEKPRLVADLGNRTHLMLRNHGLLTVGPTVADAFLSMYVFEAACAVQVRAMAGASGARGVMADDLVAIDPRIIAGAQQQAAQVTKSLGGALVWPGLLRRLARLDASFRS